MYSIGLDISKSTINVFVSSHDLDLKISNDLKSLKNLYAKLKKYYKKESNKVVFVFEPTSTYSFVTMKFCADKNIQCFIVNPKQSANFMKALGQRNKTDLTDARVLSKMIVTANDIDIKVPIIDSLIEELMAYYKLLIKQEMQNLNHLEAITAKSNSSILISTIKKEIKLLQAKEKKLITQLKHLISKDEKLYKAFKNIQTIKGVGELSSIVLLHHFLKYPDANKKQIISLAGLDPIQKTSGTSIKKKAKISKSGSKLCRSILFMATIVSINHNKEFKKFYTRLKGNGKHTTVAQIAVMRKIIIIAHSLYKTGTTYDENRYLTY